jgi:restriction system protein
MDGLGLYDELYLKRRRRRRRERNAPALLLQSSILSFGPPTDDGRIVRAVQLPWHQILTEIENDPDFLCHFSKYHRKFEEFLAGIYEQQGYKVELTRPSNDGGRDVIATMDGFCSVRILGQAKAYSPGHLVTHEEVRAMQGVLAADDNASKGMIVTTSDFAPGVKTAPAIQKFVPNRLELINGASLLAWLKSNAPPSTGVSRE